MRSIYRSVDGIHEVRQWCDRRLSEVPSTRRRSIGTALGPTHVLTAGSGPSVLFLPGTSFNAATSTGVIELLRPDFTVHVADLPGQPGLSSDTELGRDRMTRYGEWLSEVVAKLDPAPVLIVGHSLGGAIVLSGAPPPPVRRALLVCPAGIARPRLTPGLVSSAVRWTVRPSPKSARAMLASMQAPDATVSPHLVEWMTLVARHSRLIGSPGPVPDDDIARWRGRVDLVTAAHDPFFPPDRMARRSQATLGCEQTVIDDAGHLLPDERGDALRSQIVGAMAKAQIT